MHICLHSFSVVLLNHNPELSHSRNYVKQLWRLHWPRKQERLSLTGILPPFPRATRSMVFNKLPCFSQHKKMQFWTVSDAAWNVFAPVSIYKQLKHRILDLPAGAVNKNWCCKTVIFDKNLSAHTLSLLNNSSFRHYSTSTKQYLNGHQATENLKSIT